MVTIFVLKKFIRAGNCSLLTGSRIYHYLMERIMALGLGAFEDCPV